jgi:hypothetical protein
MGSAFITTRSPILSRVPAQLYGHRAPTSATALPTLPIDGRIPHSKGQVSSVVKQTLKGYEGADIAHIENALKGENRQRTITRTTKTETTISVETENTTSEEHELSSTSRFEMSKEAAKTLDEDQSLKADLKVSAKYGTAVTIDASAEGSVSRSKQEVTKTASKFSQDVTGRTVKKITEKVLEKRSTSTIVNIAVFCLVPSVPILVVIQSEIVEVNQHGINNTNGSGHITNGLTKSNGPGLSNILPNLTSNRYEAQLYNYGHRVMLYVCSPLSVFFPNSRPASS